MSTRTVPSRQCVVVLLVLIVCQIAQPARAQQGAHAGQWKHYGGDAGGTRYSPLDQINQTNAEKLKVVWAWESPDRLQPGGGGATAYECTPLAIGNTLYASTSAGRVAAINATSGETLWVFDPESYKSGRPTNLAVHRGVAYWTDGASERLFLAAPNAFLWAIDAKTGNPISEFGEGGKVDLAVAIPRATNAHNYACSSPPVICRGVIVVGSSISDGPLNREAPRGDIQAFDVRTGRPAWIFHTVPQGGEFGSETWEKDAWRYTGNTNAWTLLAADEELGYVYIPTGTPTNDWYGGHRLGDGLFAESLICLEAATGQRVWHFQTVHHGLWDYDLPSGPILCDISVDGRAIKAVVQLTKTGFCWIFDRATGQSVWPIEERPVPPSTVAGERAAPTQPFPTRPAPFERQGATEDNLIDFTPELRSEAVAILNRFDHGPLFTPPTEKGLVQLPGWTGGCNWWGGAFDPETKMLYVPSVTSPITVKLGKPDASRSNFNFTRQASEPPNGPRGLPLFKLPVGRITAIDLSTGEHAWVIPHGNGQRAKFSEIVGSDVGPVGGGSSGPLLTRTLLLIAQGTSARGPRAGGDTNALRAYDKATGKQIAQIELPASPSGTPMTYLAGGRQYVVLATQDNRLVALSVPLDD